MALGLREGQIVADIGAGVDLEQRLEKKGGNGKHSQPVGTDHGKPSHSASPVVSQFDRIGGASPRGRPKNFRGSVQCRIRKLEIECLIGSYWDNL
jgi:hypothetical protein